MDAKEFAYGADARQERVGYIGAGPGDQVKTTGHLINGLRDVFVHPSCQ